MATLSITAASFSFTQSASNAKADRVLSAAALNLGYAGDPADKQATLNYVGRAVVAWLVSNARATEESEATADALAVVGANPPSWSNGS